jgi:hypothetical protein
MKTKTTFLPIFALALLTIPPATRAEFGISFSTAVDTSIAIPSGTGNFTDFPSTPGIRDGSISFVGLGSGGQMGLYIKQPQDPYRLLANLNTAIPGGTGNFTDFVLTDLCISGDSTAFIGGGSGDQLGVYVKSPQDPYRIIADLHTAIPNGTGFFTNFAPTDPYRPAPTVSGSNVAFVGYGDSGQTGVYARYSTAAVTVIADLNTAIPAGTGNFTGFLPPNPIVPPNPIISGDAVAFMGFGSGGQQGVYRFSPGDPYHPLVRLADTNTLIPSGVTNTTFGFFRSVSMDGNNVAFVAGAVSVVTSDGTYIPAQAGVYKDIGSDWQRVADLNTPVPGSLSNFSGFGEVAIDPGYVLFEGYDGNGVHGLYTDFGGSLHKIVAAGDSIGGKTLSDFYWSQFGFSVGAAAQVVFAVDYSDGSHAITMATLTNGPCPLSQGYWKNNPRLWPLSLLTLGSQTYAKSELLSLLKTSTTSDASLILAHQLIAAKLNIAYGADATPVSNTITHADSLLSQFSGKLPYKVKATSTVGKAMVSDATTLNNYNNGLLTQFCGH